MQTIDRDQIRKIFKKVKHLRLDSNLNNVDFSNISYYSWLDETDNVLYMLYEYKGELTGIRWKYLKNKVEKRLEVCEICKKHRHSGQISLVTAKTKFLPKGINYRIRGNYICLDYEICNKDMLNLEGINSLFGLILE